MDTCTLSFCAVASGGCGCIFAATELTTAVAVNAVLCTQVLLFAEELASVVLTPFILAFSLPNCAGELMLSFVTGTHAA